MELKPSQLRFTRSYIPNQFRRYRNEREYLDTVIQKMDKGLLFFRKFPPLECFELDTPHGTLIFCISNRRLFVAKILECMESKGLLATATGTKANNHVRVIMYSLWHVRLQSLQYDYRLKSIQPRWKRVCDTVRLGYCPYISSEFLHYCLYPTWGQILDPITDFGEQPLSNYIEYILKKDRQTSTQNSWNGMKANKICDRPITSCSTTTLKVENKTKLSPNFKTEFKKTQAKYGANAKNFVSSHMKKWYRKNDWRAWEDDWGHDWVYFWGNDLRHDWENNWWNDWKNNWWNDWETDWWNDWETDWWNDWETDWWNDWRNDWRNDWTNHWTNDWKDNKRYWEVRECGWKYALNSDENDRYDTDKAITAITKVKKEKVKTDCVILSTLFISGCKCQSFRCRHEWIKYGWICWTNKPEETTETIENPDQPSHHELKMNEACEMLAENKGYTPEYQNRQKRWQRHLIVRFQQALTK